MAASLNTKILAGRPAVDFIGRQTEAERLIVHSRSERGGLLVLATPGAGATELLRQVYDRLFSEQEDVAPFYFSIRPTFRSAADVAAAFIDEFVRQILAFQRRDPSILRSKVDLDELSEVSLSVGGSWMDRMIDNARKASTTRESGRGFIRNCLTAPLRAAANGPTSVLLIDHAHELLNVEDGMLLFSELREAYEEAGLPYIVSGNRRFLYGRLDAPRLELDSLDPANATRVAEVFANESNVAISDETLDLIATQVGRNLLMMRHIVRTGQEAGSGLDDFTSLEKAYTDAVFGGRIGRHFDSLFASACKSPGLERQVVTMLFDVQVSDAGRVELERWYRRLQLDEGEADSLLERLNVLELIRLTSNFIEPMSENVPLSDYVAARFRLTSATESRATVVSESVAGYIRRAPDLMARSYIVRSALGVREVLGAFAGQKVPAVLIDYAQFREDLKGVTDEEFKEAVEQSASITLPRIFFTTATSSFYQPIAQIGESERSAIALGFEPGAGPTGEEVVWIAAEIDSKLEASGELAESWCDQLEAAAGLCNFSRFQIWLIAPEGFSPEALDTLKVRRAYGSSRRQVELLRRSLDATASMALPPLAENEYEMVIPMNGEAELIAAHAVEEIARRHNLDAKSINQLKTALVEACINASEHSLSPDGKIYQRFRVEKDRIVLTVSNRGLRLASRMPADEPHDGRRGWGLKLMRRLMDEVTIEEVDDGTRIVMTKYLKAA